MPFARPLPGLAARLSLILGTLTACCGLTASPASAQTKLATLSLRPYGSMTQADLSRLHPDGPGSTTLSAGPPGGVAWGGAGEIAIDAQGRVYLGLPIWAGRGAAGKKVRGAENLLRVIVVQAGDRGAKVDRIWNFPTVSLKRLDMRLASDGALLVLAGDSLMRLGPQGSPVKTLAAPSHAGPLDAWDMEASPSGRTLRLHLDEKQVLFVDAQTLAVTARCREIDDMNDTGPMTDDLEVGSFVESVDPEPLYALERRRFCRPRERLRAFGSIDFVPAMLDDSRFLAIGAKTLSLRTLTHETLWTSPAPPGRTLPVEEGGARLSRDGGRIAVRLLRRVPHQEVESRRVSYEDVDSGVAVWDTARGRLLAEVPLEPSNGGEASPASTSFALDPSGRLLAVMSDGVLTLWSLK